MSCEDSFFLFEVKFICSLSPIINIIEIRQIEGIMLFGTDDIIIFSEAAGNNFFMKKMQNYITYYSCNVKPIILEKKKSFKE